MPSAPLGKVLEDLPFFTFLPFDVNYKEILEIIKLGMVVHTGIPSASGAEKGGLP